MDFSILPQLWLLPEASRIRREYWGLPGFDVSGLRSEGPQKETPVFIQHRHYKKFPNRVKRAQQNFLAAASKERKAL
jgi:hypothetical protein